MNGGRQRTGPAARTVGGTPARASRRGGVPSWRRLWQRSAAGFLNGSFCWLLGLGAHAVAGGQLPGARASVLLLLPLVALCTLLQARRPRLEVVVPALAVVQFGLHLLLHQLSAVPGAGRGAGPATPPGLHSGAAMQGAGVTAGHLPSAVMTFAHAGATTLAAVCVVYGQRVMRRCAALLRPLLRLLVAPVTFDTPPRLRPASPRQPLFGVVQASSRPRRGPPVRGTRPA